MQDLYFLIKSYTASKSDNDKGLIEGEGGRDRAYSAKVLYGETKNMLVRYFWHEFLIKQLVQYNTDRYIFY